MFLTGLSLGEEMIHEENATNPRKKMLVPYRLIYNEYGEPDFIFMFYYRSKGNHTYYLQKFWV